MRRTRSGFTIVELLISVAVIAVLVALVMTGLGEARKHVYDVSNCSNLRQTMMDFAMWSDDHAGRMPNPGLPNDPISGESPFYGDVRPHSRPNVYHSVPTAWPRLLYYWRGSTSPAWHSTDGYAPLGVTLDPNHASYAGWSLPTRYRYATVMLTSPDVWRSDYPLSLSPAEFMSFYAYVQAASIAYPAEKGVHLHEGAYREESRWHASFADGSATRVAPGGLHEPSLIPTTTTTTRRGTPVLHTVDGYLGRDISRAVGAGSNRRPGG